MNLSEPRNFLWNEVVQISTLEYSMMIEMFSIMLPTMVAIGTFGKCNWATEFLVLPNFNELKIKKPMCVVNTVLHSIV